MKFAPESLTRCAARLGTLSGLERIPDLIFETPLLTIYTKRGSVPHLTRDVLELTSNEKHILSFSLPSLHAMIDPVKKFKSIADFVGLKEYPVFLTVQDPAEATVPGYNDKDTVALWTRHGKHLINPDQYMDAMEALKPDFYMTLCDGDTNYESSSKRIGKSVDRSKKMLEKCFGRHKTSDVLRNKGLLGAVEGGYNTEARTTSIETLRDLDLAGYVIDGLHTNGPDVDKIDFDVIEDIVRHTMNLLPPEKLKVSIGCWNPVTTINLIELGVDLFDSSYTYSITERSCALTFLCEHSMNSDSPIMSIGESRYAEDFTPICKSCRCLTCQNHTRAYLNHLHHTKELLERVLLMIHNTHHYLQFFEEIRKNLKNGTFQDFKSRIHKKFSKNDID